MNVDTFGRSVSILLWWTSCRKVQRLKRDLIRQQASSVPPTGKISTALVAFEATLGLRVDTKRMP